MIRELDPTKDILPCRDIVAANWGETVAQHFNKEVNHLILCNMAWPPIYYVAEIDDRIVGFAGMMPSWLMNGIWDLIWINIHPDFQGRGIGQLLTSHRIDQIRERDGTAIHLMTKQYSFFRKFGFKVTHVYDGQWALMLKQLHTVELSS